MKTLHRASLLAVALASCLASTGHAAGRSWSYTYSDLGLIETARGPQADVMTSPVSYTHLTLPTICSV